MIERIEVFNGGVTGHVNVTALRKWLELSGRKPEGTAMMTDNVKELLEAHEWDHTPAERIKYTTSKICREGCITPLIVVTRSDGAYVIDGWHRLFFIFEALTRQRPDVDKIPFPAWIITQDECAMFPAPKVKVPA